MTLDDRQSARNVISLFSGAMGLDVGLEEEGFNIRVCVENDSDAVATIKRNRPDLPVIDRSVEVVSGEELLDAAGLSSNDLHVLVGGPPCQAFSVFGRRQGIRDRRGRMVFEFVRLVDELRPPIFLMENVRGMLSMSLAAKGDLTATDEERSHGALLRALLRRFEAIGYRVDVFVVNSVNYGAPQQRERVLLVGNRHSLVAEFPSPQFSNRPDDHLPPFRTLGDAIGPESGFRDPSPEVMDFSDRKKKYLAMVPPGGNWRALPEEVQRESMGKSWYLKGGRSAYWRRLSFSFPSPTVVTMPNHAGTAMCHPTETRAISVAEAAAIQEFPAGWQFEGSTASKFKQIGNAVPTRLGCVAARVLHELLKSIDEDVPARNAESRIVHLRPHVRTRQFWKSGQVKIGNVSYYEQ